MILVVLFSITTSNVWVPNVLYPQQHLVLVFFKFSFSFSFLFFFVIPLLSNYRGSFLFLTCSGILLFIGVKFYQILFSIYWETYIILLEELKLEKFYEDL